jgi:FkbM family methyltransferase
MNKSFLTFLALITFSKVKNILPFNFALSNKSNFVFMKELESSQKKNYIFGTQTESKIVNKKKNSIVKYCIELDKIDIKKKISFIKIDCEGFELEVLQGSKRLIKKNKPIILFEYNDNKKVINYLKSLGYNEILKKQKSRNKLFAHKKNYDFKKSI